MKPFIASILAVILGMAGVIGASAQSAESIWLTASTTSYKTGETMIATVNAISATPVQGFTFQISYDPACLRSDNATSLISGMNGLSLPQTSGLVDASYAGSAPATVNGGVAEVRFVALKGCQTNLTLEAAALAIRNDSGFAAPLDGVTLGEKTIALSIDSAVGVAQPTLPASAATLLLAPAPAPEQNFLGWIIGIFGFLVSGAVLFLAFRLLQPAGSAAPWQTPSSGGNATLHVKHGPYAGRSFVLDKFPCRIGRDPINEICLNDPHIMRQHAQILASNNGYYLADLGGETFVNGRVVKQSSAALKSGDVVRLGKSALLVFGA
jgi:hypothetical protein